MRYFIDTNIFLRIVVRDDEQTFKDCVKLFEKIKKSELEVFTSPIVLAEINWTLLSVYGLKKGEVIEVLEGIIALRVLKIRAQEDIRVALDLYKKMNVKFIDALIASIRDIKTGKAVVVSYDTDFDTLGLTRKEPRELI